MSLDEIISDLEQGIMMQYNRVNASCRKSRNQSHHLRNLFAATIALAITLPLPRTASAANTSLGYIHQTGTWTSGVLADNGGAVIWAKNIAREKHYGELDLALDVMFIPDDCTPIPSLQIPLSRDLPPVAFGLNPAPVDGGQMSGGQPAMRINYSGGGTEPASGGWNASQVRQFRFGENEYIVIPFNTNNSGLNNPTANLKRASEVSISYNHFVPGRNATFKLLASFSLKGSSAAINRAQKICQNVAAGRAPDSGIATGRHMSQPAASASNVDSACRAQIKEFYQYDCGAVLQDQLYGSGRHSSRTELCEYAAGLVNSSCPAGTLRTLIR